MAQQQSYNDLHGWYRAHIEHLFGQLWHWGLVKNIWRGGSEELHQSLPALLHFDRFCIWRQVCHPPYGPWDHVSPLQSTVVYLGGFSRGGQIWG